MPNRPCPNCQSHGPRHLHDCSSDASVDYYRCDTCAHVWAVPKDGAGPARHVTPLQPRPPNAGASD